MNLLGIIQEFSRRTGLKIPTAVVTSADAQVRQLLGIANEITEDLSMTRAQWTAQTREVEHTSIAALDQGALATIAPGYLWSIANTFFDRTSNLQVTGPLSPAEWQAAQAVAYSSAYFNFRIWQQHLYIYPLIDAGHTLAFEYVSNALVYDNTTLAYKQYFTSDLDTFSLEPAVLLRGMRWAWRKEKGLPYAEEFTAYEQLVKALTSHDGVKKNINMSGGYEPIVPGIFVPDSDWNL